MTEPVILIMRSATSPSPPAQSRPGFGLIGRAVDSFQVRVRWKQMPRACRICRSLSRPTAAALQHSARELQDRVWPGAEVFAPSHATRQTFLVAH
jgi:hypothetical protein